MSTETTVQHTETSVLKALRTRHAPKRGANGPEWAYIEHVRNRAGFDANRTLDAMALGLWPSRGMELHGYEVKVSRSDFRREIADPAKMDAFAHILDRFWIVAPTGVVPAEEIPAAWGLLEVSDRGTIRQKIAAPLLTKKRAAIERNTLVPLMRAAGAGLSVTPDEAAVRDAEQRGFAKGVESAKRSGEQYERMYNTASEELREARDAVREIETALGFTLRGPAYERDAREERLSRIATSIKAVVNGDDLVVRAQRIVTDALNQLNNITDRINDTAEWIAREANLKTEAKP